MMENDKILEAILTQIGKIRPADGGSYSPSIKKDIEEILNTLDLPEMKPEMLDFLNSKETVTYTELMNKMVEMEMAYGSDAEYWDEDTEEWVAQDEMRRRKAQRETEAPIR